MSDYHYGDVLVRPVITERSMEAATAGKYTFIVTKCTTKIDIKRAVKVRFVVDGIDVNIVNRPGKLKRAGRSTWRQPIRRKAIVSLAPGQEIPEIKEAV